MKKNLLLGICILPIFLTAQTGINTSNPVSTLDIMAKAPTGTTDNVDGLLIPRVDRQRAQSMTSIPISTMIYINNITTGTLTGSTINVDDVGYYYFNGTAWIKFNTYISNNSFIPKVVASASFGSAPAVLVNDATPAFVAPTNVANFNDGNYNLTTDKYSVASTGTYQLSITTGYQLVNNSSNNGLTLFATREDSSGTVVESIILNNIAKYSYNGSISQMVYLAGNAILRANAGDKMYFLLQVCNGCAGRTDFYKVEAVYQQVSN